ncbi:MAG: cytochrome C [Candidatus Eremiobacteraeota bacterium]|nr:cytochrome C [Candidatus Eremiobacteraeota bacterium]
MPAASSTGSQAALVARGRYLVAFGACNDCHTPGWREADGNVPVSKWMTGSTIGFRGPWGTVYPANVRERFFQISESQWLAMVRTRAGHPPMTWEDLRALSIDDRRAIYAFIRSLGKDGPPSLPSVPPEREPTTPYITIVAPAPPTR